MKRYIPLRIAEDYSDLLDDVDYLQELIDYSKKRGLTGSTRLTFITKFNKVFKKILPSFEEYDTNFDQDDFTAMKGMIASFREDPEAFVRDFQ